MFRNISLIDYLRKLSAIGRTAGVFAILSTTTLALAPAAHTKDQAMSKIHHPVTTDYKIGDLVQGSDFNGASAALYRWWGVFEAPDDVDTTPFLADLFDDDVHIRLLDLDFTGADKAQAVIAGLPKGMRRSHHLDDDNIAVTYLGNNLFRIEAHFIYQIVEPDGELKSGTSSYAHILKKRDDGKFVITEINGKIGPSLPMTEFYPSYQRNRAKASIIQFQTIMDSLSGDAEPLRELMASELELHGLVAAKADNSDDVGGEITDYKELKKKLDDTGADESVIRNFDQLDQWFATGPDLFTYGIHRLEAFDGEPEGENSYVAVAQFDWKAETVNGVKIELHQPLKWTLVDTGDKYMRIAKMQPVD